MKYAKHLSAEYRKTNNINSDETIDKIKEAYKVDTKVTHKNFDQTVTGVVTNIMAGSESFELTLKYSKPIKRDMSGTMLRYGNLSIPFLK